MSKSVSKPVTFKTIGEYGRTDSVSVVCTHDRSSDTVAFDFSDGRRMAFSDEEWAAMTYADAGVE